MEEITGLREKYYILNKSFKKKFVFHLGSDAGFFSEYNNMILAMLYCLSNKIQFVLYSEDANFGYKKGWRDYFLPFCDEATGRFHQRYNFRDYDFIQSRLGRRDRLKIKIYKFFHRIDFLTQDLWCSIRDRKHEDQVYNIPDLGIVNLPLKEACQKLVRMTWQYNPDTDILVKNEINALRLPQQYIGLHIRRGDKHIEHESMKIRVYTDKMRDLNIKDVFISTDDYNAILDIKEQSAANLNFFYLCKDDQTGYDHNQYIALSKPKIKEAQIELFASVDILAKSQYFIGTYSSNIGMFLGMRMDSGKCISVDINWRIW